MPVRVLIISSSTVLLSNVAILITNEFISNLKIQYTKLRDWIDVITLLNEKTLKQSAIVEKIDLKNLMNSKRFIFITLIKEKKY